MQPRLQPIVPRGFAPFLLGLFVSLVPNSAYSGDITNIGAQPLFENESDATQPSKKTGRISGTTAALSFPAISPDKPPSSNFTLTNWKITLPDASEELPSWLTAGNEIENIFYTSPQTGAMVFNCPTRGKTTSSATKYSRTELREMLRGLNTRPPTKGIGPNNWVLSTAPVEHQQAAGGVDGTLEAVLSVDYVSRTGEAHMIGRVIVGQIHGEDDEPVRIYYRKLPHNNKGSIYFAHERPGGEDIYYPLVGSRENDAADPADGIALGEKWGYRIHIEGQALSVRVIREDGRYIEQSLSIDDGYNQDWFYFKAGLYNQNNAGDENEYAQVSFYYLEARHK